MQITTIVVSDSEYFSFFQYPSYEKAFNKVKEYEAMGYEAKIVTNYPIEKSSREAYQKFAPSGEFID
ncbi:MAG: hypothetical protein WC346_03605 [Methanogenium sp.]|jgi:hypothetical protein